MKWIDRVIKMGWGYGLVVLVLVHCAPVPPPAPTPVAPIIVTPTPVGLQFQPGDGSDLLDSVLTQKVLRVGIRVWPEAAFAPPAFRGASNAATGGAMTGFEVDLARYLAQDLGVELELVEAYPPVLLSGDWQNQWDIGLGLLTPFEPQIALTTTQPISYSRPYGYIPLGLVISAQDSHTQGLNEVTQLGVVAFCGYEQLLTLENLQAQGQPFFIRTAPTTQLIPLVDLLSSVDQLATETTPPVQAIFGPIPLWQQAIKAGWGVQLAPQNPVLGYQPISVAVAIPQNQNIDRLMAAINQILSRLEQHHVLTETYLRWYDDDFSRLP